MAVSLAITDKWVAGARDARVVTATFSGTYSTGGETLSLSQARLKRRANFVSTGVARDGSGNAYLVNWNGSTTAPKLVLSRTDQVDDPGEEVPAATSLTGLVAYLLVFGT